MLSSNRHGHSKAVVAMGAFGASEKMWNAIESESGDRVRNLLSVTGSVDYDYDCATMTKMLT
jgi:hypothetical protein